MYLHILLNLFYFIYLLIYLNSYERKDKSCSSKIKENFLGKDEIRVIIAHSVSGGRCSSSSTV